uniref:Uncharacterized protein n=1 Tax=Phenylobacterium glaciei TaxID=2803784 RepID=A0A974P1X1_9CAUL|nr:hypothetical protein JKL49_23320 [Phenylobacterium glaciei]
MLTGLGDCANPKTVEAWIGGFQPDGVRAYGQDQDGRVCRRGGERDGDRLALTGDGRRTQRHPLRHIIGDLEVAPQHLNLGFAAADEDARGGGRMAQNHPTGLDDLKARGPLVHLHANSSTQNPCGSAYHP